MKEQAVVWRSIAGAIESDLKKSLTPTLPETIIIDFATSVTDPYAVWQHFGGDCNGPNGTRSAGESGRFPTCVVKKKYAVQRDRDDDDDKCKIKNKKRKKRSKKLSCPSTDVQRTNVESGVALSTDLAVTDRGIADVIQKQGKKKKVRHNKSVKRRKLAERQAAEIQAADLVLTADRQLSGKLRHSTQSKCHTRYQCEEDYTVPDRCIASGSGSSLHCGAEGSSAANDASYGTHRDSNQHKNKNKEGMGPSSCVGYSSGYSRAASRILDLTSLQVLLQCCAMVCCVEMCCDVLRYDVV